MRDSKIDLRAANNAKMDVVGVVNAHITATSPTGKKVKTTLKIFIVEDVKEVYLSFDFMKGLRIVDTNFPMAAGKLNQHGRNELGWDRSGTIVETLPHSAYQVSMDGSGRCLNVVSIPL